jgi:hypothetical protein
MTQKTLAKSLHTVTALVQVARYYKASNDGVSLKTAVYAALAILGYDVHDVADPYDLAAKALTILNKTR